MTVTERFPIGQYVQYTKEAHIKFPVGPAFGVVVGHSRDKRLIRVLMGVREMPTDSSEKWGRSALFDPSFFEPITKVGDVQ